ncbi:hypothetical protein BpHYR1_004526 [Brachionus plicatilis]|uniref:Uncharacterized protein n=1 Tax=Brachionus plicatilis TaxID=10195 RepID=A0A3M7SJ51_BRAPC|nr:hypothetical protein BpHYR1_004526 [Brachionus plicatilis]
MQYFIFHLDPHSKHTLKYYSHTKTSSEQTINQKPESSGVLHFNTYHFVHSIKTFKFFRREILSKFAVNNDLLKFIIFYL